MPRDREPHVAHGTWRAGSLYVWGWNGDSTASSAWLYSGFGHSRWSGSGITAYHGPVEYGGLSQLQLELPRGGHRMAPAVRLDPQGAAEWLASIPPEAEMSASIAWFASLARFSLELVRAGRVSPRIVDEGPFRVARWQPALDEHQTEALAHAASVAPPVCRNGSNASTLEIVAALADGVGRATLQHGGWRPELGRQRSIDAQAARAVFAALSRHDPVVRSGTDDFDAALRSAAHALDRHRRRLDGEPVVRGRVRLTLPDDPLDPWVVDLELVDDADPGRWCTADDVWAQAPRALDVARTAAHLPTLQAAATALAQVTAEAVDVLADLAREHEPTGAELDLDQAEAFLDQAPVELAKIGIDLIGPEHLVRAKVGVRGTASAAPADDRRARFGRDALVDWQATIDDTPLSAAELARIETAGSSLMRAGHRWVRIDPDGIRRARKLLDEQIAHRSRVGAVELLRLAAGAAGDDETTVEIVGAPADTADEADPSGPERDGWITALLAGLRDDQLDEVTEPVGFAGELRHYQRRGLAWLRFLADVGLGGCLADDMGLGKTATTLAHLVGRPGPHLVVCPLSVVHNWESEARRFTPQLTTLVHHGAGRLQTDAVLFGIADTDIVITTYGLLPRDTDTLAAIDWTTVVLDEAQVVKNAGTKAARAVRQLRAAQKLALTGTPVENRLSELWAILDAVNPGLLGSQQRFREEYAGPIERNNDAHTAARLRTLTQPFVLRRTKADRRLLPDLPDKIEQIAFAQLTKEQAILYQQVVDQLLAEVGQLDGMQRRGRVLAALTRLKQICNHPAHALKDGSRLEGRSGKLNRFDELMTELIDISERALVFTQFREMGDLLQTHLRGRFGIDAPFLHGGASRQARERMVADFQAGAGAPVLLVSLKAGGTGLNLTAASQVIHYDRWWNPAVEDQATDRAWRLGQQQTVNVHKLVCQGTIEERIGAIIDDKRALADAVIGTGETWISELSTDELARLVALDRGAS